MVQMTKGVVTLTKSHGGIAFELAGTDFHHAAFGNAHRVGVREENGTATYYIQDATTPAINVSANDKSWIDADLPAHTTWNVIAGAGSVWDSLFGANGTFDSEFQVSIKIP